MSKQYLLFASRNCALMIVGIISLIVGVAVLPTDASQKQPNVVFILADDLGWADISCHKGMTPTPHIDRFFQQNVELTTFFVTPLCSPTRAAFMTGRYPARSGIAPYVIDPRAKLVPKEELTLGEAFQSGGYTTACIGKWHLGETISPNEQGFDYYQGNLGGGVDYFTQYHMGLKVPDWWENGKLIETDGYTTDIIANRAVRYIKESGNKPFFLYLPFTAVHTPIQATKEYLARVPAGIEDETKRIYSAMTIALDDAVGKILESVQIRGIAKDTIVVFTSDNGATPWGNNLPFRGGKHTVYEGGVHVPAAISWPGHLKGERKVDAFMSIEDMYPTLLEMAEVKRPKGPPLDGKSMADAIIKGTGSPCDTHCWIWKTCDAIRKGKWKFVRHWSQLELFDLGVDPGEARNLIHQFPQQAYELNKELDKWHKSLGSFPSHVPVRSKNPPQAKPGGDVVEIRVGHDEVPEDKFLWMSIAAFGDKYLSPGDRLEYDMFIPEGSATTDYFIDVTVRPKETDPFFWADVVDQYGNFQGPQVGFPQANGQWAHRVIGLANNTPLPFGHFRIAFVGKKKADYLIYLDNIIYHRGNGEVIELYRDGKLKRREIWQPKACHTLDLKPVPFEKVNKKLNVNK